MAISQNEAILNHLKSHTGITAMEAFRLYNITRLSARIHDLKERGHHISTLDREVDKGDGKKTRFCEYRLVKNYTTVS